MMSRVAQHSPRFRLAAPVSSAPTLPISRLLFFFQAEDGIRDWSVTGVQTCALPIFGANGVLDGVEQLWPHCHEEAHDLGKVVYARLRELARSLQVCANRCNAGCMHGVLKIGRASCRERVWISGGAVWSENEWAVWET